jgi:NAD(P)-dependent dehydrogenase (short-subunit alcohol dehydrogenase family)
MKIILIGATGTLGKAVDAELSGRHDIVRVGNTSGELQVDIADRASIQRLFEKTGEFDALISMTGSVHFGPLPDITEAQMEIGLRSKLMGQVNLVLLGLKHARDGASFTLTSGLLSDDPIRYGAAASMVNGALDSFVRGAAIELPRGIRINAVSPTVVEESLPAYGPYFRGFEPVPASKAALAYSRSAEGAQTGQIYRAGWVRQT